MHSQVRLLGISRKVLNETMRQYEIGTVLYFDRATLHGRVALRRGEIVGFHISNFRTVLPAQFPLPGESVEALFQRAKFDEESLVNLRSEVVQVKCVDIADSGKMLSSEEVYDVSGKATDAPNISLKGVAGFWNPRRFVRYFAPLSPLAASQPQPQVETSVIDHPGYYNENPSGVA